MGCIAKSKGDIQKVIVCQKVCVPKISEIEGVVRFLPTTLFAFRSQSMGCIAKSFKGDIQKVVASCAPKSSEIEGVVDFYPKLYLASIGQTMG